MSATVEYGLGLLHCVKRLTTMVCRFPEITICSRLGLPLSFSACLICSDTLKADMSINIIGEAQYEKTVSFF